MRYVYPDLKALRFGYKGGAINCFWKDLLGFSVKRTGLYEISFNYARFGIFWSGFFEGIKRLFTDGKVKETVLRIK